MIETIGEGLYIFKWILSRYAAFIGYMLIFLFMCFGNGLEIEFIRAIALTSLIIFTLAYFIVPEQFRGFCKSLIVD